MVSFFFENRHLLSGQRSRVGWDKKPTLTIHLSHSPRPSIWLPLSLSHLPTLSIGIFCDVNL